MTKLNASNYIALVFLAFVLFASSGCKRASYLAGTYGGRYDSLNLNEDSTFFYKINRGIAGRWVSIGKWRPYSRKEVILNSSSPNLEIDFSGSFVESLSSDTLYILVNAVTGAETKAFYDSVRFSYEVFSFPSIKGTLCSGDTLKIKPYDWAVDNIRILFTAFSKYENTNPVYCPAISLNRHSFNFFQVDISENRDTYGGLSPFYYLDFTDHKFKLR